MTILSPEHTTAAKFLSEVSETASAIAFAETAILGLFFGSPLAIITALAGYFLLGAHEDLKRHNNFQWPKKRNS